MEETFNMQNGRLLLTEQGVDIRYSKSLKIYLVVLSIVYAVWIPIEFGKYHKSIDYQDIIMVLVVILGFIASLYFLISLSRNREIRYDRIKSVTIKKGAIIDRIAVRLELVNGQSKRVYFDYNEYVLNGIKSTFEMKGIEVVLKWKAT